MPELGSAVFRIYTDAKDFFKDMKKAEREANRSAAKISDSLNDVSDTSRDAADSTEDLAKEIKATSKQMSLFGDETEDSHEQLHLFNKEVGKANDVVEDLKDNLSGLTKEERKLADETERTEKATKKADNALGKFNARAMAARTVLRLMIPPALIAGIGVLVAGVSALTGGVVALTSAAAPAAGAMVTLGQAFVAVKQGALVAKLGLLGVEDALGDFEKNLQKPNKRAKEFADFLKGFGGEIRQMRNIAQKGILGDLETGLTSAARNLPRVNSVIEITASHLGNLARRAGEVIGSRGFGRDFEKVGTSNATLLWRMGNGAISLSKALMDVLVVARPLTNWLGKSALNWTRNVEATAQAGRESGRTATFFERTKRVLTILSDTLGNLWRGFKNVGDAARPLGMDILRALEQASQGWADWTETVEGENALKGYFKDIKGPIFEAGRLVRDITNAFFRMGRNPALKPILKQLRTEFLPVLEEVLNSGAAAFGPVLVDALVNITRLIGELMEHTGPLHVFVATLSEIAGAAADLLDSNPGLAAFLATMGGIVAATTALNFAASITGAKTLVSWLAKVRAGYVAASAASTISAGASAGAGAAAMGGAKAGKMGAIGGALAAVPGPAKIAAAAIIAIGAAFVIAYKKSETFRNIVNGVWSWLKQAATDAAQWVVNAWNNASRWVKTAWDNIKDWITGAVNVVTTEINKWKLAIAVVKAIGSAVAAIFKTMVDVISKHVKAGWQVTKVAFGIMKDIITGWGRVIMPIVEGYITFMKGIFEGGWEFIKGLFNAFKTFLGGYFKVLGGILRGDFGMIWDGIKDIFKSGWEFVKGTFEAAKKVLGGLTSGIGKAITGAFEGAVRNVVGIAVGLVNGIISVINKIPGVEIGKVQNPMANYSRNGGGMNGGSRSDAAQGFARGGAFARTGGKVNTPMTFMGEEAPAHPEWVIPENPAYRKRALGLWQAAGRSLGALPPGRSDAVGGPVDFVGNAAKSAAGAVGDLAGGALDVMLAGPKALIGLLPDNPFSAPWTGMGTYALDKAKDYITSKFKDFFGGDLGGEAGNLGMMTNLAARFGLSMTSGYRPGDDGWHGQNRARDYSNGFGPTPQQLAFARFVAGKFGSNLLELIYTPMGFGIKNGRRVGSFGAAVDADHFDHVHVAMARGGMWGGKGRRRKGAGGAAPGFHFLGQGSSKIGRKKFMALAEAFGIPAKAFWQITKGESDHNMFVQQRDPGDGMVGYGGFQLTPNAWGAGSAAMKRFNQLGGVQGMRNILNQFKMARFLYSKAGNSFSPWYGTRFLTDRSGEGSLGGINYKAAKAALGGKFSGGGKGGTGTGPRGKAKAQRQAAIEAQKEAIKAAKQAYRDLPRYSKGALKSMGAGYKLNRIRREKDIAPTTNVPANIAKQLQIQEDYAQAQFQKANDKVKRLTRKNDTSRAGKAKLASAIEAAQTSLDNLNRIRGDIKSINEEFAPVVEEAAEVYVPTAIDFANAAVSVASLTTNIADDIKAMKELDKLYFNAYNAAVKSGDPVKIAQAASDYQSVHQSLMQLIPTATDYADARLAQAELTPELTDDLTALQEILGIREKEYAEALKQDDPRKIAEAARNLKTARDNVKSVEDQLAPAPMPTVLSFGPLGPTEGTISAMGAPGSTIQVIQNFHKAAEDEYTLMKQAEFAAGSAFSTGG